MKIFYYLFRKLNTIVRLSSANLIFEQRFQKENELNNLEQNKVAIAISLVFHIVYIGVSYLRTPEDFFLTVIILTLVPISLSIVFLYTIQKKIMTQNIQFKLFIFGLGIGFSPILVLNFTELYYEVYITNAMLPLFGVFVMYGVPFATASFAALVMLISLVISILFVNLNIADQVYYIFLLSVTFILSAISGYLIEKNQRRLYYSKYKQEKLNEELLRKEKLLQEQARLAQMGEMISMIAHQWRQPLGAIGSASVGIQIKHSSGKYDLDVKEEQEAFLEYMNKKLSNIDGYVKVLTNTIDDFRNFFKPNKDKELASITASIEKSLSIMSSSLESNNISVVTDYQTKDELLLYQSEMMQVVLNIIKNAEDNFSEKSIQERRIKIITKKEKNTYILEISDNGGGIEEKILKKIFDPYFSTKDEKNGSGLGLYMSKIMVEEHNKGKLLVENIDSGVSFKIIFGVMHD